MSKLYKALQKSENVKNAWIFEAQQSSSGNEEPQATVTTTSLKSSPAISMRSHKMQMFFTVLIAVAVISLGLQMKTSWDFRTAKVNTVSLSENINNQTEKITTLEALIVQFREERIAQLAQMNNRVDELNTVIKEKDDKITDIEIENNILAVKIRKVSEDNDVLMSKYIELGEEVDTLKESSNSTSGIDELSYLSAQSSSGKE